MVRKTAIAAALAALVSGMFTTGMAEERIDPGMLHWIRDTVCTPGREIVFVPVSNDVKARHRTWAVIAMDNPDPDSAHVVDAPAKHWLLTHGCDDPAKPALQVASRPDVSGRLDF